MAACAERAVGRRAVEYRGIRYAAGLAFASLSLPVAAQRSSATPANAASNPAPADPDIVVYGQKKGDRYRLAPQFRTPPSDRDTRWRSAVNRDFTCHDVGRGCPIQPNTILTVKSDGSTRLGDPKSRER